MLFFINGFEGYEFLVIALSYIVVVLLSLSLHEFAHALAAYKSGDLTPKTQGRLSLNPLKHIDPIGAICCAIFGFGWAKPVQINPSNFRNIKKGITWTSIAGVLMNLFLSFLGYGFYALITMFNSASYIVFILQQFFYLLYWINLCLAVFNFLPIYPLDGFKLIEANTSYNNKFVQFMYRYGNLVLILFIVCFDSILFGLIETVSKPIELFWNLIF